MRTYVVDDITINRFVYKYIDSNMYVILNGEDALIVDAHVNEELQSFLKENKIKNVTIILTHEHYDHTCGIPWLSDNFKTTLICNKNCSDHLSVQNNNRPILITYIIIENDRKNGTNVEAEFNRTHSVFATKADVSFDEHYTFNWHGLKISFQSIPGHSKGSSCININDKMIFTGDSLLLNLPTITRFPGGNTKVYNEFTLPYLKSLDRNLYVLPGHEDAFYLRDKFTEPQ